MIKWSYLLFLRIKLNFAFITTIPLNKWLLFVVIICIGSVPNFPSLSYISRLNIDGSMGCVASLLIPIFAISGTNISSLDP